MKIKFELEFNRDFVEDGDVIEGGDSVKEVEDVKNSKKDKEEVSLKKRRR